MSIKKYSSGSWVTVPYRKYETATDTITSLPQTIIGDGQPISSYTIKGNMVQSGTPTPSNPIYPQEVGDLVTTGEHAGEYEIPILSNGNTYPVYLAEPIRKIGDSVDTAPSTGTATRNIYKWVFTGNENWILYGTGSNRYFALAAPYACIGGIRDYLITSHFETSRTVLFVTNGTILRIYDTNSDWADETSFKTYLQQQYSNGTPVTVWYVLATATTESFTPVTIPTTGTAEQFDVSTTLKPSEVSLTYHGWHDHTDTKYTSG